MHATVAVSHSSYSGSFGDDFVTGISGRPGTTNDIGHCQYRRIRLDGPDRPDAAEALYYLVEASYPQDWQEAVENTFKVMVNGHAATYEGGGSGGGSGEANASFWVYLGTTGKKTIEVTLVKDGETISAEKKYTVAPEPAMRLLGHYDGECLFENETLPFLAYSMKDAAVKVHGKDVELESKHAEDFDGLSILTIPPSLKTGNNTIENSGADPEG